ncbi:DNA-directed RNA polymerase [Puccinia sorghi]|uniref:DNA-directed RNA polymerase subunit n=1 Tax=Puccinia sorghi TaxID=27349 RepID=A0A0L6UI26_9BASI|nr:DNA-directed RNA polymerase [Puccinia sorghi]
MNSNQFVHSSAPTRRVRTIQFGIMSPDEIKGFSVAKIEHPETYEEGGIHPRVGGLSDPRMGTIDRNMKCQTCGEDVSSSDHQLDRCRRVPVTSPTSNLLVPSIMSVSDEEYVLLRFLNRVKKILECVCIQCAKLKADVATDSALELIARRIKDPKKRFNAVHQLCRGKNICEADPGDEKPENPDDQVVDDQTPKGHGGCGHAQPQIRKEGLKMFLQYSKRKGEEDEDGVGSLAGTERKPLPASEAQAILRRISDEDLHILGLHTDEARPEWMILTVLPIPPPPVRPSIAMDGGATRGEDDLTYKLAEVIKANQAVRKFESEGAPAHVITEFETLLQWHIATYMDNDLPGQPQALQKSGRPIKSLRARLKGKEGRLRGNLMGKRVDFSARTVITGDPNLQLDQVGVPYSIARNLTYPERVTPYNISYLQELVQNGPTEYPGARYVVRDTGDRIDLRYNKRADTFLQYGWIVERHLKDGDYVLFNRQPSLHKMSMMSHRIKLMPYSTFRLNLSVTSKQYPTLGKETRAELAQIAWVPRNIVSPQANKPVMGIVQDTLCGVRKFTLRDCFMDRDFIQNILLWVPGWDGVVPPPAILKPKPLWTGKQILSMCIPKGINLLRDDENQTSIPIADKGLWIEDGEIIYGVVDKKCVGASQGGLIHVIFREKGPQVTRGLFSGIQMVVNYWLLHHGFSIGIGDTVPDKATMEAITNFISEAKREVSETIALAQEDKLQAEPGMTIRESFEAKVNRALNTARDNAGRSAEQSLKDDNNVKQMVTAGSKGSFINISQMSACVGQQSVEGKRIPYGFKYRTLPHFTKDDYSPESRGFVENSYLRGLTPQEFFFHAMAGREGLIDTAVKTAETGYIQRRLLKALEDVMVTYDGTVRNSLGDIVQFVYGEDGVDGGTVEYQNLDSVRLSNEKFDKKFRVDVTDPKSDYKPGVLQVGLNGSSLSLQSILDAEWKQLCEDRETLRKFIFTDGNGRKPLPVNIRRIIQNAQQIFHIDFRKPSDLPPQEIIQMVNDLCDRIIVVRGDDALSRAAQENCTLLFRILLRSNFATRRVLEEFHLNREAFEWVLGEIEARFNQSLAAPGEMCGTLAAQSIGEPATQMTLNTFHYAGVSSKNVTLGVPRLKEIINVATNIKTPSLTVYLNENIANDIEAAKDIQTELAHTTLKTVTASTQIIYDPNPKSTVVEEDLDFVDAFFAVPDDEVESQLDHQSPWLLRLELDRAKMLDKKLSMSFVASKIAEVFKSDLFIIWSEDNAEKLIIRCRAMQSSEADKDDDEGQVEEDVFLREINQMLGSISLRGVEGIQRVFMLQHNVNYINHTGEFERKTEWVLETDGVNLKEVLCVDGVDPVRTVSNNCVEILTVLGVEAARASLLKELRNVIEFDGSYVNYRHLALLCDLMTNRGALMAITRHGINRTDTGPLMRCSFEETVEILMDAAALGEKDHCTGVAENVLLGQLAPMGTGAFDVALDLDMLKDVVIDHRLPVAGEIMGGRFADGAMTPGGGMTPYAEFGDTRTPAGRFEDGPVPHAMFSPIITAGADDGFGGSNDIYGGYGGQSPYGAGGGTSPGYSPSSPSYNPAASPAYTPTSPTWSGASPWVASGTSPGYSPTSPRMGATSPRFSSASPPLSFVLVLPASPNFVSFLLLLCFYPLCGRLHRPTLWSPASPAFVRLLILLFTPRQLLLHSRLPRPGFHQVVQTIRGSLVLACLWRYLAEMIFIFSSPAGLATSPRYSPTSPAMSPSSPKYSPASPAFSPASPKYSPATQRWSPQSPAFSPASPKYSVSIGLFRQISQKDNPCITGLQSNKSTSELRVFWIIHPPLLKLRHNHPNGPRLIRTGPMDRLISLNNSSSNQTQAPILMELILPTVLLLLGLVNSM